MLQATQAAAGEGARRAFLVHVLLPHALLCSSRSSALAAALSVVCQPSAPRLDVAWVPRIGRVTAMSADDAALVPSPVHDHARPREHSARSAARAAMRNDLRSLSADLAQLASGGSTSELPFPALGDVSDTESDSSSAHAQDDIPVPDAGCGGDEGSFGLRVRAGAAGTLHPWYDTVASPPPGHRRPERQVLVQPEQSAQQRHVVGACRLF